MYKILVCGGRDFSDLKHMFSVLDYIHAKYKITCVVNGEHQAQILLPVHGQLEITSQSQYIVRTGTCTESEQVLFAIS